MQKSLSLMDLRYKEWDHRRVQFLKPIKPKFIQTVHLTLKRGALLPLNGSVTMYTLQSKWRYLIMFLGVQLVVMALLSREGYQKRVSYFFRIFRKPDSTMGHSVGGRNHTDVYANLSLLGPPVNKEDMPYCPKQSPLIGEFDGSFNSVSSFWSLSIVNASY